MWPPLRSAGPRWHPVGAAYQAARTGAGKGSLFGDADVFPATHITLAIIIVAHGDDRAVGPEAHGVIAAGADRHDVGPVRIIFAHGDNGAVSPEAYGVEGSRADRHDVFPATHITLAMIIVAHGDDGAISPEAYGVGPSCADRHDVSPATHITLAKIIVAHGDDGAISPTISMVDCRRLEPLAEICADLFHKYAMEIATLKPEKVQKYYRSKDHWFYDLLDIVVQAGAAEDEIAALNDALDKCVLYCEATSEFMDSFEINTHSGFSMYLPSDGSGELDKYYRTLKWNMATGLVE